LKTGPITRDQRRSVYLTSGRIVGYSENAEGDSRDCAIRGSCRQVPSHHQPFKRLRLGKLIAVETAVLRYDCQPDRLAFKPKKCNEINLLEPDPLPYPPISAVPGTTKSG
jgi:hypothetical protein